MMEENISWEICKELIAMIDKTFQASGVLIVHKNKTYDNAEGREGV